MVVNDKRESRLSVSPDGVNKLADEIEKILERHEVFPAQMLKLVGKLNFAQTSVMGGKGERRCVHCTA